MAATTRSAPERADGGREQEGAVGAAAVGDQHRAALAQVGLEGREPDVEQVLVEPGREVGQVVEDDVGAGREQLLAGAAAGEHRDARSRRRPARPRRRGRGRRRRRWRPRGAARRPCRRPRPQPSRWSRSRPRWSTCSRALGANLPVTTTTRPRVAAYGGERLGGARRAAGPGRWRGRGRAPGTGRPRRSTASAGRWSAEHRVERRAQPGGHLLDREVDAELGAERQQRRRRSPARCRSGSCRGRSPRRGRSAVPGMAPA